MARRDAQAADLKPFADDDTSLEIGALSIENGKSRIAISRSIDIVKDNAGLESARALRDAASKIVAALEAEGDLPERTEAEKISPIKQVRNPFA